MLTHSFQHDYDTTIDWYKNMAEKHKNLVKYTVIGQSYEGRDMPGIHVTASTNSNRKKIYLQCQIHAREYTLNLQTHNLYSLMVLVYG